MGAAANAHDVDRHVGFYAHDASTMLIFNGESIVGWKTIRDKQREWWSDGKTDVVYTVQGKPEVRMLKADLAVTTLFMTSRRTGPNGEVKDGRFAVSALWQRRPEGWRVIYSHESTTPLNFTEAVVRDRRIRVETRDSGGGRRPDRLTASPWCSQRIEDFEARKVLFIVRYNHALVCFCDGGDNHIQVASRFPGGATFRHETSPDQCRLLVK